MRCHWLRSLFLILFSFTFLYSPLIHLTIAHRSCSCDHTPAALIRLPSVFSTSNTCSIRSLSLCHSLQSSHTDLIHSFIRSFVPLFYAPTCRIVVSFLFPFWFSFESYLSFDLSFDLRPCPSYRCLDVIKEAGFPF